MYEEYEELGGSLGDDRIRWWGEIYDVIRSEKMFQLTIMRCMTLNFCCCQSESILAMVFLYQSERMNNPKSNRFGFEKRSSQSVLSESCCQTFQIPKIILLSETEAKEMTLYKCVLNIFEIKDFNFLKKIKSWKIPIAGMQIVS